MARPWTWCFTMVFFLGVFVYFCWNAVQIFRRKTPSVQSIALTAKDWQMPNFMITAETGAARCMYVHWDAGPCKDPGAKFYGFENNDTARYWFDRSVSGTF